MALWTLLLNLPIPACMSLSKIWHLGFRVQLEKGLGGRSRRSWVREVLCIPLRGPQGCRWGAEHAVQVGQASSLDLFSEFTSVPRMSQTCQLCEFILLPAVWPLCRLPFHAHPQETREVIDLNTLAWLASCDGTRISIGQTERTG